MEVFTKLNSLTKQQKCAAILPALPHPLYLNVITSEIVLLKYLLKFAERFAVITHKDQGLESCKQTK